MGAVGAEPSPSISIIKMCEKSGCTYSKCCATVYFGNISFSWEILEVSSFLVHCFSLMCQKLYLEIFIERLVNRCVNEITVLKFNGVIFTARSYA